MDEVFHDVDGNVTPEPSGSDTEPDSSSGFEPVIRHRLRQQLSSLNKKCQAANALSAHLLDIDQIATWANKLMVLYERVDKTYGDLQVRGFFQNTDHVKQVKTYEFVLYVHRFLTQNRERKLEDLEPSKRKFLVAVDQVVSKPKDFAPYATRSSRNKTNNQQLIKSGRKLGEKGPQDNQSDDMAFAFGKHRPVQRSPTLTKSTGEPNVGSADLDDDLDAWAGFPMRKTGLRVTQASMSSSTPSSNPNSRPNLTDPNTRKQLARDLTLSLRTPTPSNQGDLVFFGNEVQQTHRLGSVSSDDSALRNLQADPTTIRDDNVFIAPSSSDTPVSQTLTIASSSDAGTSSTNPIPSSSVPTTNAGTSSSVPVTNVITSSTNIVTSSVPVTQVLTSVCNQLGGLAQQLSQYRTRYSPPAHSANPTTGRNVQHVSFSLPPPPLGVQSAPQQTQVPVPQVSQVPRIGAVSTHTSSVLTGPPLVHAPLPIYPPSSSVFPPISVPTFSSHSMYASSASVSYPPHSVPAMTSSSYVPIYPQLPTSSQMASPMVGLPPHIPVPAPTYHATPQVVTPQPSSMGSNTMTLMQMLIESQRNTNKMVLEMMNKPRTSGSSSLACDLHQSLIKIYHN